ncbi:MULTISPECIES: iron ABC transporter ATP-binding protein [Actibacterium]|uniref:Iron complex transport system ATP-binding protein n=1 Tax=Actibacterium naphthalenivorans TaxID=1614693 RepID=A0A840CPV6_9RHOB|nr:MULTISPECIES: ATP-binding cassette domain-containing protein [Actibacterium]ALG90856.1 iron ABC transporter ATP-binding protein [Actibacterium sp. EMB200-NS6]MBB4023967.1 iron complex transport system ATP-binding protein [Actibacterium naphthalenivorans]
MIEISRVSHRIGDAQILKDITLSLPRGGITALIGPNGAGKSTLLSLMSRLMRVQTGRISFDGLDVGTTKSDFLARKLSIMRQENTLSSRLTVGDLVGYGRYPHHKGRPGPQDRQIVDQALEFLNLTHLRDRFMDELSGGQRQRAFVAMVLAQDTDYVLLDEPLNNLDMAHSRAMMQRLRRSADDLGKTFVIVVHDINFAASYADRIIALRDGAVLAEGSPAQIVTRPMLRRIFDLEIEVRQVGGHPVAIYQIDPPNSFQPSMKDSA